MSHSNFVDDIDFGLSQLYANLDLGKVSFTGGKFPNPFRRTDLIWDGDVNPQGLYATFSHQVNDVTNISSAGLYMIIEENAAGSDSTMTGGQCR